MVQLSQGIVIGSEAVCPQLSCDADRPTPLAGPAGTSRTPTYARLSCWRRKPLKGSNNSSSRRYTRSPRQPLPRCPSPPLTLIPCPPRTGHTHPTSEPLPAPHPSLCPSTQTKCTAPWHRQRVSLVCVCLSVFCLIHLSDFFHLSVCLSVCLSSV